MVEGVEHRVLRRDRIGVLPKYRSTYKDYVRWTRLFFVISDDGPQLSTVVTSITPPNSTQAVQANIHSDAVRVRTGRNW